MMRSGAAELSRLRRAGAKAAKHPPLEKEVGWLGWVRGVAGWMKTRDGWPAGGSRQQAAGRGLPTPSSPPARPPTPLPTSRPQLHVSLAKLNAGCTKTVAVERRRVRPDGAACLSVKHVHAVIRWVRPAVERVLLAGTGGEPRWALDSGGCQTLATGRCLGARPARSPVLPDLLPESSTHPPARTTRRGSREGDRLVFEGDGEEAPDSLPGDLILVLRQKPHPVFRRLGGEGARRGHLCAVLGGAAEGPGGAAVSGPAARWALCPLASHQRRADGPTRHAAPHAQLHSPQAARSWRCLLAVAARHVQPPFDPT